MADEDIQAGGGAISIIQTHLYGEKLDPYGVAVE